MSTGIKLLVSQYPSSGQGADFQILVDGWRTNKKTTIDILSKAFPQNAAGDSDPNPMIVAMDVGPEISVYYDDTSTPPVLDEFIAKLKDLGFDAIDKQKQKLEEERTITVKEEGGGVTLYWNHAVNGEVRQTLEQRRSQIITSAEELSIFDDSAVISRKEDAQAQVIDALDKESIALKLREALKGANFHVTTG